MKNSNKPKPLNVTKDSSSLIEEYLDISSERLIGGRKFDNLNWVNLIVEDMVFKDCSISNSNFSQANLNGLRFENCKIFNCNFEKSNLTDSIFENCVLYEKEKQQGCYFRLANLENAKFYESDISLNNFERAECFQITIDHCRAQGCNFQFTNFSHIISRTILLSIAYLTYTDFKYSNFEGVYLKKCDLSNSKFGYAIFSRANLEESDLTHTEFSPSLYDGLSIVKADLRNAQLNNMDIKKLDFQGVKILEWQQEYFMENLGIIVYPSNG